MLCRMLQRTQLRQFLEIRVWVLAIIITTFVIMGQNLFLSTPNDMHGLMSAPVLHKRYVIDTSNGGVADLSRKVRQQTHVDNTVDLSNDHRKRPYYLGCWLIPYPNVDNITKSHKMSPRRCLRHCDRELKTYASISNGNQCGCSDTLHEYLASNDCDHVCPGNKAYQCGGLFTSSVYAVGQIYPSLPIEGSPRKVLLLAYMRTGSTFTSQMFNTYADSFYIFEPFFRLEKFQHLSVIQNLLSCQFDRVPKEVIMFQWTYWHRRHMQLSLSHFFTCMDKLKSVGYYRCLPLATTACEKSTLRIIKEIEIDMASAVTMQKIIPDMYVFHLVRDPRAVTNSRINVHERNTPKHLDKYCRDVEKDLKISKAIPSENFFFLQYENITEHPLEVVESIYKFIKLNITQEVLEWVKEATGIVDRCKGVQCLHRYGTIRKNSSTTAYKWKATIPHKIVKYVDKACKPIYGPLGYLPINGEKELRNPLLKHRTW